MGGPTLESEWNLAFAFPDAWVVEEDDRAGFDEGVDESWVPEIHVAAEMDHHYEWCACFWSETTVGCFYAICGDVLGNGGLLGRHLR